MPRPEHYWPAIKRNLVTALYHEAKRQGRPMTVVTNDILERGLQEMVPQRPTKHGPTAMVR
jgi:hypothetical protein